MCMSLFFQSQYYVLRLLSDLDRTLKVAFKNGKFDETYMYVLGVSENSTYGVADYQYLEHGNTSKVENFQLSW